MSASLTTTNSPDSFWVTFNVTNSPSAVSATKVITSFGSATGVVSARAFNAITAKASAKIFNDFICFSLGLFQNVKIFIRKLLYYYASFEIYLHIVTDD